MVSTVEELVTFMGFIIFTPWSRLAHITFGFLGTFTVTIHLKIFHILFATSTQYHLIE